jgi:prophage DNA circulation protein
MARPFATLAKASFLGIEFRVESHTIRCGIRKFDHEYPHAPAAKIEKLGRKPYMVTLDAVFMVGDKTFPTAWPGDIGLIRSQAENQVSGDLVIPTVGTIPAICVDWDISGSNKVMNGEKMRLTFEEDQDVQQLVDAPLVLTYTNVTAQASKFQKALTASGIDPTPFAQMLDLASQVDSYQSSAATLQFSIIGTKLSQLADLGRTLDVSVRDLNQPAQWPVVNALHDLVVTADNLNRDLLAKAAPLGIYAVTREMAISQLSTAIYGDTTRAVELMQLNAIEDVFAIQPGVDIVYYQVAA